MSVRAYATPTATSASTPSASTVHRARSPHFLPRERPGDAEERLPPDPREPPERTEGEGVAWACLASARVRGLRWLMVLSGTGWGAVERACEGAKAHKPNRQYGGLPWRNLNPVRRDRPCDGILDVSRRYICVSVAVL